MHSSDTAEFLVYLVLALREFPPRLVIGKMVIKLVVRRREKFIVTLSKTRYGKILRNSHIQVDLNCLVMLMRDHVKSRFEVSRLKSKTLFFLQRDQLRM